MSELLSPGTLVARDFRIVRPLSAGGMGSVYVADQLSTGSQRALKVMHPALANDARLRERFEQEARTGARIESEHVVQVITAGVDEQSRTPFLVMELLDGEDLATHVERLGPMPPDTVREVLAQLCHALGAAHRMGIVHRDVKPENVFLAHAKRHGGSFTVKLLDFGIAKIVAEARTSSTETMGTPFWMAPEQTERLGSITPRTDVWPLGLLAFWMLTGKHFWRSANDENPSAVVALREIALDPLPTADARAAELGAPNLLPPGFATWFEHCVSRAADARFADATEAFTAFDAMLAGQADALVPTERGAPPSTRSVPVVTEIAPAPARKRSIFPIVIAAGLVASLGVAAAFAVRMSQHGDPPAPSASAVAPPTQTTAPSAIPEALVTTRSPDKIAADLGNLCYVHIGTDNAQARKECTDALAQNPTDDRLRAMLLYNMSLIECHDGHFDRAQQLSMQSLTLRENKEVRDAMILLKERRCFR